VKCLLFPECSYCHCSAAFNYISLCLGKTIFGRPTLSRLSSVYFYPTANFVLSTPVHFSLFVLLFRPPSLNLNKLTPKHSPVYVTWISSQRTFPNKELKKFQNSPHILILFHSLYFLSTSCHLTFFVSKPSLLLPESNKTRNVRIP
jgi:hypothetical protein